MGGVCSGGGASVIQDARDGSSIKEGLGSPGGRSSASRITKEKGVSLSDRKHDRESWKALKRLDAGESPNLKPSSSTKRGPSKLVEKIISLERARISGIKQTVQVLNSIGKSLPDLSKEVLVPRGNTISILAFEVANTIVKGESLLQSLSESSIQSLTETLHSKGVQSLVSTDMNELMRLAASDKREELDVFLGEVIRFGDLCKDPQWHNLGQHFSKLDLGISSLESSREEAMAAIGELSLLARCTCQLYHELNVLDRFEKDYKQKLEEAERFNLPHNGGELMMLRNELKNQRKAVKGLKRKSLWSRNMDEIMVKLVEVATGIHQRIMDAFGSNGMGAEVSNQGAEECKDDRRLGPTGLALHYANMIVQIDTIASRPACLPRNVRDSLYHSLPSSIKKALSSRLQQAEDLREKLLISRVKTEMEKTSSWLVPFATSTIKAHQKLGWVGDWANAGKEESSKSSSTSMGREPIRLETLYHADKEKMDLYILDLLVWLHHLISLVKQRVNSMTPLALGSSRSNRNGQKIHPKVQKIPHTKSSILKPSSLKPARVKLPEENKEPHDELASSF
ncbi:hypothetical protein SAY87_003710 [Trapa incisa]|uniref:Uncharacterized protein n=1 Tax=Trapa incisa TaxID=236973 RepID=A0AAN7KPF6_9MYRT|nr:hypothetical protein SAY87_003710 [Trapa incisa]